MPELPEAETIVRGLRPHLPGRRILHVEVLRPDLLPATPQVFVQALEGRRINGVGRRGKNVVVDLAEGYRLVVNLGMTGKLLLARTEDPGDGVSSHPGIRIDLSGGVTLWYDDVRRFGRLEVMEASEWGRWSEALGPEPLGARFTAATLHAGLSNSISPLRSWLLDQRRVAGVGNIYALEALFRAGLHPQRPARTVDKEGAGGLHRAVRLVLRQAIEHRGTTLRDYRDPEGGRGENGPRLAVYGREGAPCRRCETPILRVVFSNRSAFLCPTCQPENPA